MKVSSEVTVWLPQTPMIQGSNPTTIAINFMNSSKNIQ